LFFFRHQHQPTSDKKNTPKTVTGKDSIIEATSLQVGAKYQQEKFWWNTLTMVSIPFL
jgi:hypothetical protein